MLLDRPLDTIADPHSVVGVCALVSRIPAQRVNRAVFPATVQAGSRARG
jgi:hypothetical protein